MLNGGFYVTSSVSGTISTGTLITVAWPPQPQYQVEQRGNMRIVHHTDIDGLKLIQPGTHRDARGEFRELFNPHLAEFFPQGVVQISQSTSKKNVLRGFHFQVHPPMGKLIGNPQGQADFFLIDLRKKSNTFLKTYKTDWSRLQKEEMIYVPPGVAVAFWAKEDDTVVRYFHSSAFNAERSETIAWDDPDIGLFLLEQRLPILSKKDWRAQSLKEWLARPESDLL